MTLHDIFLSTQEWWLADAGGPLPLFAVRIVSGTLALIAAIVTYLNALHPNEIEHTWDESDCKRFKIIGWIKMVGCMMAALYFLSAAMFEVDRTSSPNRLLINNFWASLVLFSIAVDGIAWRYHYLRKRLLLKAQGENIEVKA